MKESKYHRIFKKLLFAFIVALLFLPMLQQKLELVELKPLNGSYTVLEDPWFSLSGWFEGKYQLEQQKFSNENFGFRNGFVRIYNQAYYELFNEARANSVVIGKDNYLYEENYIQAYLGRDFIGHDKIAEKVDKLKKVSDTLRNIGIELIVVLAPGKGSFYPEFIPEKYEPLNRSTTNYEVYQEKMMQSKIALLDFNGWFNQMKDTSTYTLFPKTGIHWSKYGAVLAADSIISYINSQNAKTKMPELIISEIEKSVTIRGNDDDIEKGMNLLIDIPDLEMGYPQFKTPKYTSTESPKVLTVADSYYWEMFGWGLSRDVFNGGQFWYYNEQIYPESYKQPLDVKDIDFQYEVEKNDVILLMSTDGNLHKFAFGFIDQLYDCYYPLKEIKPIN